MLDVPNFTKELLRRMSRFAGKPRRSFAHTYNRGIVKKKQWTFSFSVSLTANFPLITWVGEGKIQRWLDQNFRVLCKKKGIFFLFDFSVEFNSIWAWNGTLKFCGSFIFRCFPWKTISFQKSNGSSYVAIKRF